jgi:Fe-S oxidoreductase
MCPTFRALGSEAAAPRAKANLFRAVMNSAPLSAGDDAVRAVADLCVNCKMCALECPGKADIPKLMLEAKAANHAEHGLRRAAWFLARMEGLTALGSRRKCSASPGSERCPLLHFARSFAVRAAAG